MKVPHDFVLCREVPDIDRSSRVSEDSSIIAPVMYEVQGGSHDKQFVAEVVATGPGVTQHGEHETMCVASGELLVCNLQNISYKNISIHGQQHYMVRNGVIAAALDRETFKVTPLQDWILVIENERRAVAHSSGGMLWVPTGGFSTDDEPKRNRGGMLAEYGEVISQGPGRWKEGQWLAPACSPGDLILYDASYGTLPITIRGRAYVLVPSSNVALVAESA